VGSHACGVLCGEPCRYFEKAVLSAWLTLAKSPQKQQDRKSLSKKCDNRQSERNSMHRESGVWADVLLSVMSGWEKSPNNQIVSHSAPTMHTPRQFLAVVPEQR
jgi:hypothetical protein